MYIELLFLMPGRKVSRMMRTYQICGIRNVIGKHVSSGDISITMANIDGLLSLLPGSPKPVSFEVAQNHG